VIEILKYPPSCDLDLDFDKIAVLASLMGALKIAQLRVIYILKLKLVHF